MKENMTPGGPLPTYDEYYKYLLVYAKKLEAAVEDNTPSQKKSSETDYLTPYSPSASCYSNATDLLAYMLDRGDDVDMIHDVLQCYQAMIEGRPRLPPQTRRQPVHNELKILNPTWSGLQGDTKKAWSNKTNENKEKIIAQFVINFKSSGPVTKNHNLRMIYKLELRTEMGKDIILIVQQILKVYFTSIPTLPSLILLLTITVMGRML